MAKKSATVHTKPAEKPVPFPRDADALPVESEALVPTPAKEEPKKRYAVWEYRLFHLREVDFAVAGRETSLVKAIGDDGWEIYHQEKDRANMAPDGKPADWQPVWKCFAKRTQARYIVGGMECHITGGVS